MKSRYIAALGALGLAAFGFVAYHDIDTTDCGTDTYDTVASPDGRHKAVAFGVDCGATTGFNTQLSILPSDAVLDRNKYQPVLVLDEKLVLSMRWTGNVELAVTIPKMVRVYKQDSRSGDVSVTYD